MYELTVVEDNRDQRGEDGVDGCDENGQNRGILDNCAAESPKYLESGTLVDII